MLSSCSAWLIEQDFGFLTAGLKHGVRADDLLSQSPITKLCGSLRVSLYCLLITAAQFLQIYALFPGFNRPATTHKTDISVSRCCCTLGFEHTFTLCILLIRKHWWCALHRSVISCHFLCSINAAQLQKSPTNDLFSSFTPSHQGGAACCAFHKSHGQLTKTFVKEAHVCSNMLDCSLQSVSQIA